jgi:cytochrome c-type biogenesis protein CcmH
MLILAFAFVLPPLLRQSHKGNSATREKINIAIHKEHLQELQDELNQGELSQKDFEHASHEIERALLSDITDDGQDRTHKVNQHSIRTAVLVAIVLPIFAIGVYLTLGETDLIDATLITNQEQSELHSIEEMVAGLNSRLQEQDGSSEDWLMLARSNLVLERFDDAVIAYRRAYELLGDDPQLLSDFAEAMILANNTYTEESMNLINLALQKDPDTPKALWLAGNYTMRSGETVQALEYFERLLNLLPPDSSEVNELKNIIEQIKQESDLDVINSTIVSSDSDENTMTESTTTGIEVSVSLDPVLLEKISPDDTVFIFARATQGPRMPLAIVRTQASELPVIVTLDDSTAMSPATKLSKFNQVIIGARISKSGDAMPRSGDMQGVSTAVKLREITGVKITINEILP